MLHIGESHEYIHESYWWIRSKSRSFKDAFSIWYAVQHDQHVTRYSHRLPICHCGDFYYCVKHLNLLDQMENGYGGAQTRRHYRRLKTIPWGIFVEKHKLTWFPPITSIWTSIPRHICSRIESQLQLAERFGRFLYQARRRIPSARPTNGKLIIKNDNAKKGDEVEKTDKHQGHPWYSSAITGGLLVPTKSRPWSFTL